jgi:ribosome maturation factor RimP
MENFDHILLFKTSCGSVADKKALQVLLENQRGIEEWNLDLDDCDNVLRIISHEINREHIIQLMNDHGYECCELT